MLAPDLLAVSLLVAQAQAAPPPEPIALDTYEQARDYVGRAERWVAANPRDPRASRVLMDVIVVGDVAGLIGSAELARRALIFTSPYTPQARFVARGFGSADAYADFVRRQIAAMAASGASAEMLHPQRIAFAYDLAANAFGEKGKSQPYIGAIALVAFHAVADEANVAGLIGDLEEGLKAAEAPAWSSAIAAICDRTQTPAARLVQLDALARAGDEPARMLLDVAEGVLSTEDRNAPDVRRVRLRLAIGRQRWPVAAAIASRMESEGEADDETRLLRAYAVACQGRHGDVNELLADVEGEAANLLRAAAAGNARAAEVMLPATNAALAAMRDLEAIEFRVSGKIGERQLLDWYVRDSGEAVRVQGKIGEDPVAYERRVDGSGRLLLPGEPTRRWNHAVPRLGVAFVPDPGGNGGGFTIALNTDDRLVPADSLVSLARRIASEPPLFAVFERTLSVRGGMLPLPPEEVESGGTSVGWLSMDADAEPEVTRILLSAAGEIERIERAGLVVTDIRYGRDEALDDSAPEWPKSEIIEGERFDAEAAATLQRALLRLTRG